MLFTATRTTLNSCFLVGIVQQGPPLNRHKRGGRVMTCCTGQWLNFSDFCNFHWVPSWKLRKVHFEDDFPFPQVGYVNPLEGILFVVQVIPLVCLITVQVSSAHAHAPNQYELASEFSSAESSTSASSTVLGRPEESASGDLSWNCGECCHLHGRSRFVASQFHSQQATITMLSMHIYMHWIWCGTVVTLPSDCYLGVHVTISSSTDYVYVYIIYTCGTFDLLFSGWKDLNRVFQFWKIIIGFYEKNRVFPFWAQNKTNSRSLVQQLLLQINSRWFGKRVVLPKVGMVQGRSPCESWDDWKDLKSIGEIRRFPNICQNEKGSLTVDSQYIWIFFLIWTYLNLQIHETSC